MAFGFFKKKKKDEGPHYDPLNIKVWDIRKGFLLDYDLKSWEVKEEFEYDWGNEYFTYEYKLEAADETIFLYIEIDDEVVLTVSKKIPWGRLDEEVEESILEKQKPPKSIEMDGKTYYREGERPGFFKNVLSDADSEEFISWEYIDESEKFVLNIEQWEDNVFEASLGKYVEEREFSNILPVDM